MTDEQLIAESIIKRGVDATTVFRFVKLLSTDFSKWAAYETGVIDDEGNTLKKSKDRKTPEEKSSFTMFHRLVRNIKRLVAKVPFGKTLLGNFAAALFLIREYAENPYGENLEERFNQYMEENKDFLNESFFVYYDQITGLSESTTTGAVQGYDKPLGTKDDEEEEHFMGSRVFRVPSESYMKSRFGKVKKYGKYSMYVGSDETGLKIREYGRKCPKKGIILKDDTTGCMLWLRKPGS